MAASVSTDKRVVFDVIKVNMFGVKQVRLVVIDRVAKEVHICTAEGKIKRQLVLAELTGVEEWPASSGKATEDIERSLVFKFAPGQSSEAKRDLLFNNKRQRDAFLEELSKLDPRLSLHYAARMGGGGAGGGAASSAILRLNRIDAARRYVSDGGDGGPAPARSSSSPAGSTAASPAAGGALLPELRFVCTEENAWGMQESRFLCFSDDDKELVAIDTTSMGDAHSDTPLRRLEKLYIHASAEAVCALQFTDGAVLNARTVKRAVFTFLSQAHRDRFILELRARADKNKGSVAYTVEEEWVEALPTRAFHRFEAVMRCKRGTKVHFAAAQQVVLLASIRRRRVYVIKTKDIGAGAGEAAASALSGGATTTTSVASGDAAVARAASGSSSSSGAATSGAGATPAASAGSAGTASTPSLPSGPSAASGLGFAFTLVGAYTPTTIVPSSVTVDDVISVVPGRAQCERGAKSVKSVTLFQAAPSAPLADRLDTAFEFDLPDGGERERFCAVVEAMAGDDYEATGSAAVLDAVVPPAPLHITKEALAAAAAKSASASSSSLASLSCAACASAASASGRASMASITSGGAGSVVPAPATSCTCVSPLQRFAVCGRPAPLASGRKRERVDSSASAGSASSSSATHSAHSLAATTVGSAGAVTVPLPRMRLPTLADPAAPWMQAASWPHDGVKLWTGTFNVSGCPPPQDLRALDPWLRGTGNSDAAAAGKEEVHLHPLSQQPDMYVFGFQELGSAHNRELWVAAMTRYVNAPPTAATSGSEWTGDTASTGSKSLTASWSAGSAGAGDKADGTGRRTPVSPASAGSSAAGSSASAASSSSSAGDASATSSASSPYVLVESIWMWEMGIYVFVKAGHLADVTTISKAELPTGIAVAKAITGVQLGNKGGVGISLRWRNTSLAFVNCHLPARPDVIRLRKREADYRAIVHKLKLETLLTPAGYDWMHSHDHAFLIGDMNYRVDLPFERVAALHGSRAYGALAAHDQLIREQRAGRVFGGFQEGEIAFGPTYRWKRKTPELSWKRGQAPSYTDRVFHRSLPGAMPFLTQVCYDAAPQIFGSDHRPVYAVYTLGLRRPYPAPAPPLFHVPYPVPSFYSVVDAPHMHVPVVLLGNLRITHVKALAAPAGVSLALHAPWLSESPAATGTTTAQHLQVLADAMGSGAGEIALPVARAAGLTRAQREELRALRLWLVGEAKRVAARERAAAKLAKKAAKAGKAERLAEARAAMPAQTGDLPPSSATASAIGADGAPKSPASDARGAGAADGDAGMSARIAAMRGDRASAILSGTSPAPLAGAAGGDDGDTDSDDDVDAEDDPDAMADTAGHVDDVDGLMMPLDRLGELTMAAEGDDATTGRADGATGSGAAKTGADGGAAAGAAGAASGAGHRLSATGAAATASTAASGAGAASIGPRASITGGVGSSGTITPDVLLHPVQQMFSQPEYKVLDEDAPLAAQALRAMNFRPGAPITVTAAEVTRPTPLALEPTGRGSVTPAPTREASVGALQSPVGSSGLSRAELAQLTVQYSWASPAIEGCIPPIRPACWDPRVLREAHLHVLATGVPGADGALLAMGNATPASAAAAAAGAASTAGVAGSGVGTGDSATGAGADASATASTTGDGVAAVPSTAASSAAAAVGSAAAAIASALGVSSSQTSVPLGQAVIPLEPVVSAATAALVNAIHAAGRSAQLSSSATARRSAVAATPSNARAARASLNTGGIGSGDAATLPWSAHARVASVLGIVESTPDSFARAFRPADGMPWALTAPAVPFAVPIEHAGQVVGVLSGTIALRSHTDPSVVTRTSTALVSALTAASANRASSRFGALSGLSAAASRASAALTGSHASTSFPMGVGAAAAGGGVSPAVAAVASAAAAVCKWNVADAVSGVRHAQIARGLATPSVLLAYSDSVTGVTATPPRSAVSSLHARGGTDALGTGVTAMNFTDFVNGAPGSTTATAAAAAPAPSSARGSVTGPDGVPSVVRITRPSGGALPVGGTTLPPPPAAATSASSTLPPPPAAGGPAKVTLPPPPAASTPGTDAAGLAFRSSSSNGVPGGLPPPASTLPAAPAALGLPPPPAVATCSPLPPPPSTSASPTNAKGVASATASASPGTDAKQRASLLPPPPSTPSGTAQQAAAGRTSLPPPPSTSPGQLPPPPLSTSPALLPPPPSMSPALLAPPTSTSPATLPPPPAAPPTLPPPPSTSPAQLLPPPPPAVVSLQPPPAAGTPAAQAAVPSSAPAGTKPASTGAVAKPAGTAALTAVAPATTGTSTAAAAVASGAAPVKPPPATTAVTAATKPLAVSAGAVSAATPPAETKPRAGSDAGAAVTKPRAGSDTATPAAAVVDAAHGTAHGTAHDTGAASTSSAAADVKKRMAARAAKIGASLADVAPAKAPVDAAAKPATLFGSTVATPPAAGKPPAGAVAATAAHQPPPPSSAATAPPPPPSADSTPAPPLPVAPTFKPPPVPAAAATQPLPPSAASAPPPPPSAESAPPPPPSAATAAPPPPPSSASSAPAPPPPASVAAAAPPLPTDVATAAVAGTASKPRIRRPGT